jgi:hypothetical protein
VADFIIRKRIEVNPYPKGYTIMKQKVFFPCYGGCEFNSLAEAVNYVQQMRGGLSVYIDKIIKYNIRFRDCLRENGIDGVIKMLIAEAPAIALETKALDYLKEKWTDRMKEHIADYDIQCLPKDSLILIDDYLFNGLDEIDAHSEMSGNPTHRYSKWYSREGYMHNPAGLHVGNIWVSYPKFDSFDDCDNRSYNNYFISKEPLTEEKMDEYCNRIDTLGNACMVHEFIPEELLPVLYWDGDSDNVLLATKKV